LQKAAGKFKKNLKTAKNWNTTRFNFIVDNNSRNFVMLPLVIFRQQNYKTRDRDMKKTIAILSGLIAGASLATAQELSISSTFAWESEYIFRGERLADEYFAPALDVSYGDFYAGVWAALPVEGEDDVEVDFYAGYGFGISETVSADIGFTWYTYPDYQDDFLDGDATTFEIYGGLSFEAPLSPAAYVFYDFDLEQLTLEASAGHTIDLSDASGIDLSAFVGYADRDTTDIASEKEWLYYGAGAAYTYAFTDNASASVGVNYYGADEALEADGSKSKFTLSASFTAGF
jgi:uncharacterized protein (TIGR02001 family)